MTVISNATIRNWENIYGIIIRPEGMQTIWKAIIAIDPTFPTRGQTEDLDGKIIKEWKRIPTPLEVLRAIKFATNP